jgi:restriction endonuclease Mrr
MALTSQQVLRTQILQVLLAAANGSARRKDVLREMDRRYGSTWSPEDRRSPLSRPFERKWMNRASFERANMVRAGLLKDKASGFWTLTAAGRDLAGRG